MKKKIKAKQQINQPKEKPSVHFYSMNNFGGSNFLSIYSLLIEVLQNLLVLMANRADDFHACKSTFPVLRRESFEIP
jgi:hypothetical protein